MNKVMNKPLTYSYAGIGSRRTPQHVMEAFTSIAIYLEKLGLTLNSGGADGADLSFEIGVDNPSKKRIFIPWRFFNGSDSIYYNTNPEAFTIAERFHPNWNALSQSAKKLMARNTHQILGFDLHTPVDFVICWTEKGLFKGGTAQAMRIAKEYDIPIFNAGAYEDINEFKIVLWKFLRTNYANK